jgi:hypothetical protein
MLMAPAVVITFIVFNVVCVSLRLSKGCFFVWFMSTYMYVCN